MRFCKVVWICGVLAGCPKPSESPPKGESCLECHAGARDRPPGLHGSMIDGCVACHRGRPDARTADAAHQGLEREPGALDTADETCGRVGCHADLLASVRSSLMSRASGIVAVDRWAFGEIGTPTTADTMEEALHTNPPSPAQSHLRRLCGGCHLDARKDNRDDAVRGVGTGCSACHARPRTGPDAPHPSLDLEVPDARCFGCHSRSARVSLSYVGLYEVRPDQASECADSLPDPVPWGADGRVDRPVCYQQPDAHWQAGLGCVDCHLHTELMGDGQRWLREAEQTELRCETCHGPTSTVAWSKAADRVSEKLVSLRGRSRTSTAATRTGLRGTPVWNLILDGSGWVLEDKSSTRRWSVPETPTDSDHRRPGHERLACAACHAAWVPTCSTCHTRFDPKGRQWDFGSGQAAPGRWIETAERFEAAPPGLALARDRIQPALPGMVATLDASAYPNGSIRRVRLVSAIDPHTTTRSARSCESCHQNPRALGLGEGRLVLEAACPRFEPTHSGGTDGWTGLFPDTPAPGTHPEVQGLDAPTQRRVLRVGYCLGCHPAHDRLFRDFEATWRRFAGSDQGGCPAPRPRWTTEPP